MRRRGTVTMSRHEIDPSFPVPPGIAPGCAAPGGVGSAPGAEGSLPGGAGSAPGGGDGSPAGGGVGSLPGGVGSCAWAGRTKPPKTIAAQRAKTLARQSNLRMLTSRATAFEQQISQQYQQVTCICQAFWRL